MSESETYVRYAQELFTNKLAMQAMMQNNQEIASKNAEFLFKHEPACYALSKNY